jgi:hypothetical protein
MKQFYNQPILDLLSSRIEALGRKLSPQDCTELRSILHDMASLYFGIAEVYKMAEINLIPGKVADISQPQTPIIATGFKPSSKSDKGNPLSELLGNMSEADKAKLMGALESNVKKE